MKPNDDNGKLPSSERPYATGRLRKLPHEHYFDPAEEPFVVEALRKYPRATSTHCIAVCSKQRSRESSSSPTWSA